MKGGQGHGLSFITRDREYPAVLVNIEYQGQLSNICYFFGGIP